MAPGGRLKRKTLWGKPGGNRKGKWIFMEKRYPVPALQTANEFSPCPLPEDFLIRFEEETRRSRFITSLGHAPDRETARLFIDAVRREFPDADHHCWAYAAGAPGDTAQVGQSDDGEPHGTAGRPMLDQLLRSGTGELAAVTARYFGGVKLGTGGLARAYRNGVAQALALLPVREKTRAVWGEVAMDHAHVHRLHRLLPAHQAIIERRGFDRRARFRLRLPEDRLAAFLEALQEATDGAAQWSAEDPDRLRSEEDGRIP
jgi:uncharacterized YigZ family protein